MRWLRPLLQNPRQYLACAVVWLFMAVPSYLWWKQSVLLVIVMSLYTIVKSELVGATATELSELDVERVAQRVLELLGTAGHLDGKGAG